jgi:hypothetical protein
VVNIDPL